jgi:hypothetical protein
MNRNLHIQEELAELSKIVSAIPYENVYTVPEGYFNSLYHAIGLEIHKNNPYQVPEGYFNSLSSSILNRIASGENAVESEISEIAPVLAGLHKTNLYKIPAGYFENFSVDNREEAKLVTMAPVAAKKSWRWLKIAAAACMAGLLTIAAFNIFGSKAIAKEDQVIAGTHITYKEIKNMNVEAELDKVTSEEADSYLCENGLVVCNDKDNDLENELDQLNISDEELDALIKDSNN